MIEELLPVANTAVHDSRMNEVEVVGWPGPGLLDIVDFELEEQDQHRVKVNRYGDSSP